MKSWRNLKVEKAMIILLTLGLVLAAAMIATTVASAEPNRQTYNLVWSDEFNGSSLDMSNWVIETGGHGWGNGEREYYTNGNNLIFNGSTMTIQARKENPPGSSCWYGTCQYSSSRLKTAGKREFRYGRIEGRLSIPVGQGLWPAFWTLGANIGTIGWPKSGEIDIMEHVNLQTQTHGVIHWDNNGHVQFGGQAANSSVSSFHTYSIEWDSSAIRWYMDGGNFVTANILNNINSTEEFHLPHFILLNLAVGGAWPGDPDGATVFPANYQIDYVRVYQQGGTGPTATPTPTNTPSGPTNTPSSSTNIALNKPVTCSSTENAGTPCANAVDGSTTTRWASAFSDPQWIRVDLGSTQNIGRVLLNWEAAYGKSYQIQTSNDGTNWTTIYSTTTGNGGIDDLTGLSGSGRYVRMNGTVRATQYGYSLWEFEVYPGSGPVPTATPTNTAVGPTPTRTNTPSSSTNKALNRPVTCSPNPEYACANAVDGNTGTRWSSAHQIDPQWIYVDLGSTQSISRVVLRWEAAYGKSYQIHTSNDAVNWTQIYSTTTGDGGVDDITGLAGSGRYVRMNGSVRALTLYGYSLWEFEVY